MSLTLPLHTNAKYASVGLPPHNCSILPHARFLCRLDTTFLKRNTCDFRQQGLAHPGGVRIWLQRPEHRLEFISLRTQTDSGQVLGSHHPHAELTPLRWQGASPSLFLDIPISISQKKKKLSAKCQSLQSSPLLTVQLMSIRNWLPSGATLSREWEDITPESECRVFTL